jgi:cephalosporin hydroxylase
MKFLYDDTSGMLEIQDISVSKTYAFTQREAFEIISNAWLRIGWDCKHVYSFTWMGRPIIQLPEDMVRIQEVIYGIKPDIIIETGIAHGGSLVFYASLCKTMGHGRVIGVDIEIRPHNRKAIEEHDLFSYITLLEGNSVAPVVLEQIRQSIKPNDTVLVLLDSCHQKQHVLQELESYSKFVTLGSYIVAMDGIMKHLKGASRTQEDWDWNNPSDAVFEFLAQHPEFVEEKPKWKFNESLLTEENVTYWPNAWLKKIN